MTQLLLDLKPEQIPTLANFVTGANGELLGRLSSLAERNCFDTIYLWGPEGGGKSHLLTATAALAAAQRPVGHHAGATVGSELAAPPGALVVVDDVDALSAEGQIALFRVFNAARLVGLSLLLAGREPPLRLDLREDLRTRIGQTLVYEVKPLSDDEKAAALTQHAQGRGMRVQENLLRYLLAHGRRDLPSLMAVLDGLDRLSLEQHRPATLPLLKEVMQLQMEANEARTV